MLIVRWMTLAVVAALACDRALAQETPDTLTGEERGCEQTAARSLIDFADQASDCLVACYQRPGQSCHGFFLDPQTFACIDRARSRATVRMLNRCGGFACPECWGGGQICENVFNGEVSQALDDVRQALDTLYCDDGASPDGLSTAERRCQAGLTRASTRYGSAIQGCLENCQHDVADGRIPASACDATSVGLPGFDARTQACLDRAARRFATSCNSKCADPPDCFPFSCDLAGFAVGSQVLQLAPTLYCQDEVQICGDGRITGREPCDPSAVPSGCSDGFVCLDCEFCAFAGVCGDGIVEPPFELCDGATGCPPGETCSDTCDACLEPSCGDGQVETGESCDPGVPSSCGDGTMCEGSACGACLPAVTATEDVSCTPGTRDVWQLTGTPGTRITVRLDTVDGDTAADLCLDVSCSDGQSVSGDDNFACTFPPPEFSCPLATVVPGGDGACTVTVDRCSDACTDPALARYRLDVSGATVELVTDDAPDDGGGAAATRKARR